MRVFAYCAEPYAAATRRAAGVEPLCCPPVTDQSFNPRWLEGEGEAHGLIFFNLHGLKGVGAMFGGRDGPPVALRVQQLKGVDLGDAVVFAEVCHLGDEGHHPMREALLEAGASAVIAGPGPNYGALGPKLGGADVLGLWVRRGLERGLSARAALRLAKARLVLTAVKSVAARDALGFRLFVRE